MRGSHMGHCPCHTLQNASQACGKQKPYQEMQQDGNKCCQEMQQLKGKIPEWLQLNYFTYDMEFDSVFHSVKKGLNLFLV